MKVYIPISAIKASIHAAATKDIRYCLNGVLFEFVHSEEGHPLLLRLVSTDGMILSAFNAPLAYEEGAQSANFEFIVPLDTMKTAAKSRSKVVLLESLPDGRYSLGGNIFTPIDGVFPDWRRVVPLNGDGMQTSSVAQFNPELLLRAHKALNDFYQLSKKSVLKAVGLDHNGPGCGVMHCGKNDAVVVIMPYRRDVPAYTGFNRD